MRFCDKDWPADTEILQCVNVRIDELTPLQELPGLRQLSLYATNPHRTIEHPLRDLSPLTDLPGLVVLEIARSRVDDITPRWWNLLQRTTSHDAGLWTPRVKRRQFARRTRTDADLWHTGRDAAGIPDESTHVARTLCIRWWEWS